MALEVFRSVDLLGLIRSSARLYNCVRGFIVVFIVVLVVAVEVRCMSASCSLFQRERGKES